MNKQHPRDDGTKPPSRDQDDKLLWDPAPMVGWYDPRQLLRTAIRIAQTSLFATNADVRLMQPLLERLAAPDELGPVIYRPAPDLHGDAVIDYISDTGDGFGPTYAVAYWATQRNLGITSAAGDESFVTQPGDVLVLGGDQVYATPSEAQYRRRFVLPFTMASSGLDAARPMFAIPGNHDWYDNLVAFRELFMRQQRIGSWQTMQRRSYFALQLPHRWWLLATDMQLGSEIDTAQFEYFEQVERAIGPEDGIILCHAEPHWIYAAEARARRGAIDRNVTRVEKLEQLLDRNGRLRMVVAGDLHHYRRYSQRIGQGTRTLVTAGGGGAFLHPTHTGQRIADESGADGLLLEAAYPSAKESRALTRRILLFPIWNGWFLLASGAVYGLVALSVFLSARTIHALSPPGARVSLLDVLLTPSTLTWSTAIVTGFLLFTDNPSPLVRWLGGSVHGFIHAAVAALWPCFFTERVLGPRLLDSPGYAGLAFATCVLTGAVFGSWLMGVYLWSSLRIVRRHGNEAFSALRVKEYKSFLRLRISERSLELFAIGIPKVPEWATPERGERVAPRRIEPVAPIAEGDAAHPILIERVVVTRSAPTLGLEREHNQDVK